MPATKTRAKTKAKAKSKAKIEAEADEKSDEQAKEQAKKKSEKEIKEKTAETGSPDDEKKAQKKKRRPTDANLIPNSMRSKEEVRANSRKGGIRSGQVRRAKKEARELLKKSPKDVVDWLYSLKPDDNVKKIMSENLGIPIDEIDTVEKAAAVSMYNQVRKGNVKAFEALEKKRAASSDSDLKKVELDLKQKELEIKKERHEAEMAEIEKKNSPQQIEYRGIPILKVSPAFAKVAFAIERHDFSEYVFPGGRGSTKSSFISLEIMDLLQKHSDYNALILRSVGNTIADSVFSQMKWAIHELGLDDIWIPKNSVHMIVNAVTKQTIYFRGADDPLKLKSIKPIVGYIAVAWFEELDQFIGPEAIRNIEQSAIRGGDDAFIFKSFNPPRSKLNWANKYILIPKEKRIVVPSTYLDVPGEWLGKTWLEEADFLKETNPQAYENEYLGVANGNGGNVFENVEIREITNEEIAEFDRIYQGIDWGWYPDPYHYSRMHYDQARMTLYIFGELRCNKKGNEETARMIREKFNTSFKVNGRTVFESIDDSDIFCDSAEMKSVADYRDYGTRAKAVVKGPGSVDYSMKWLARLLKIVIDPVRCPETAKEFTEYEYERDKEGNVISGYPDKDNHAIDSVRYAMYPVWRRKGE